MKKCPRCKLTQEGTEECPYCGFVFEKEHSFRSQAKTNKKVQAKPYLQNQLSKKKDKGSYREKSWYSGRSFIYLSRARPHIVWEIGQRPSNSFR